MLSYRLGTVNDFHWGFKPVLSYSKPRTFSTSLGEEKERKNAFNLSSSSNIYESLLYVNTLYIINNIFYSMLSSSIKLNGMHIKLLLEILPPKLPSIPAINHASHQSL